MIFSSFIKDYLIKGGLQKGDKVLLHSNLKYLIKSLLNKKIIFDIDNIVDSILEFLGPKGTLVVPTFNFDFCEGKLFSFLEIILILLPGMACLLQLKRRGRLWTGFQQPARRSQR